MFLVDSNNYLFAYHNDQDLLQESGFFVGADQRIRPHNAKAPIVVFYKDNE